MNIILKNMKLRTTQTKTTFIRTKIQRNKKSS